MSLNENRVSWQTQNKRSFKQPPFVMYAFAVTAILRQDFKINRVPSEWLGHRKLGTIFNNYNARVDARTCAETVYSDWERHLQREFLSMGGVNG